MKIRANYKTEVITDNQPVDSEKCNSIIFENIGADHASINSDIPLRFDGPAREFMNDPGVFIQDQFQIKFEGNSSNKTVLITKRFYEYELPNRANKSVVKSGCDRRC